VTTAAVLLNGDAVEEGLKACDASGERAAHPTTPTLSSNAHTSVRLGREAIVAWQFVKASPLEIRDHIHAGCHVGSQTFMPR
jgi:hypothetical protein